MIKGIGICRSFQAKARAIEADIKRKQYDAAKGSLNSFINELKAQGDKHVIEPAMTILREEADAILRGLDSKPSRRKAGSR